MFLARDHNITESNGGSFFQMKINSHSFQRAGATCMIEMSSFPLGIPWREFGSIFVISFLECGCTKSLSVPISCDAQCAWIVCLACVMRVQFFQVVSNRQLQMSGVGIGNDHRQALLHWGLCTITLNGVFRMLLSFSYTFASYYCKWFNQMERK